MKGFEDYPKLTIRISKINIFDQKNRNDGYGCRYLFRCDEIPEYSGYGLTVSDALQRFRKIGRTSG